MLTNISYNYEHLDEICIGHVDNLVDRDTTNQIMQRISFAGADESKDASDSIENAIVFGIRNVD